MQATVSVYVGGGMKVCIDEACETDATVRGYCRRHYRQFLKHGATHATYNDLTLSERFWSKVDKSGDCWLWMTGKDAYGYGQFSIGHKKIKSHRFAYEMANGPIPEGLVIDHACHSRACVNPSHLRAVTHKQNMENLSAPSPAISGVRGVHWKKDKGCWGVYVKHNKKPHYGGSFSTREEAAEAARQLRLSLFTHNELDRKPA